MRVIKIMKYAGAYIAFEIGSGFATGQEILQFYTSYGLWSIAAAILSMVLFSWVGGLLMEMGYMYKDSDGIKPYNIICGKYAGAFYQWFVTVYLFAMLGVMISGAGATIKEYYGFEHYVGAAAMALLVFGVFIMGLNKLIDAVGLIGPVIIGFSLFVAVYTIWSKGENLISGNIDTEFFQALKPTGAWWMSGILYVAYNTVSSVAFLMALGRDARSAREARLGGVVGGVLLMVTVIFMDLALMCDAEVIKGVAVPALRMAGEISPAVGTIFVAVMLLGIFSTAAPILWTVCDNLAEQGSRASMVLAFLISIDGLVIGQMPFDKLVAAIYPLTGYMGMAFMVCLAWYSRNKFRSRTPVSMLK